MRTQSEPSAQTDSKIESKQSRLSTQADKKIEPEQSRPMLYTYTGKNGKLGLINQNGKIIAAPQYDENHKDFFCDQSGKNIMGIIVKKGQKQHIYYIDGKHVVCKEKCNELNVMDGGRYAYIIPWSSYSLGDYGVYDLQTETYLLRPKRNQQVTWSHNKFVYKRGGQIWLFDADDHTTRKIPGMSDYSSSFTFLPQVGWYVFDGEKVFDSELKEITTLRKCTIHTNFKEGAFTHGNYAIISISSCDEDGVSTSEIAFVNRQGKIFRKGQYLDFYTYRDIHGEERYVQSTMFDNYFQVVEKDGTTVWLDQNLNELARSKDDMLLNHNGEPHNILMDKNGSVIRAVDQNFKTKMDNAVYRFYGYLDESETLYRLKDGKWKTLDLKQFLTCDYQKVTAPVYCEDYVIVCVDQPGEWKQPVVTNMQYSPEIKPLLSIFIPREVVSVFAVDWDGRPVKQCPLSPYFQGIDFAMPESVFPKSHWQGGDYYWVANKTQRGYLNTKGEWLFVEPA